MGASGGDGMTAEQRYYQEMQLQNQEMQLQIAKQQMEVAKQQIVEPEKKVDASKEAADDTAKAARLRRGIGSAFSRESFGKGSVGSSATSGQSAKLGG